MSNNPPLIDYEELRDGIGCYSGVTLRDLFAAAALAGILSNGAAPSPKVVRKAAYEFADMMLAERASEEIK